MITNTGDTLESKNIRMTPVVKIAPTVICPSMPIFHQPAVKVANKPQVTNNKGTHTTKTFANLVEFPVAPSQIS